VRILRILKCINANLKISNHILDIRRLAKLINQELSCIPITLQALAQHEVKQTLTHCGSKWIAHVPRRSRTKHISCTQETLLPNSASTNRASWTESLIVAVILGLGLIS